MSEVDIEDTVSDIDVALIPLFLVSLVDTTSSHFWASLMNGESQFPVLLIFLSSMIAIGPLIQPMNPLISMVLMIRIQRPHWSNALRTWVVLEQGLHVMVWWWGCKLLKKVLKSFAMWIDGGSPHPVFPCGPKAIKISAIGICTISVPNSECLQHCLKLGWQLS